MNFVLPGMLFGIQMKALATFFTSVGKGRHVFLLSISTGSFVVSVRRSPSASYFIVSLPGTSI